MEVMTFKGDQSVSMSVSSMSDTVSNYKEIVSCIHKIEKNMTMEKELSYIRAIEKLVLMHDYQLKKFKEVENKLDSVLEKIENVPFETRRTEEASQRTEEASLRTEEALVFEVVNPESMDDSEFNVP